jgi:hypothetical protein
MLLKIVFSEMVGSIGANGNKDYWVEWISVGGYIAVRNDAGKIKPYAPTNFYKGNV